MHTVYILVNRDIDKYYIGITSNIGKRVFEHNKPKHKTKFTRKQPGIWELVYREEYMGKKEATKRERQIKSWKSKKMIDKMVEQSRP